MPVIATIKPRRIELYINSAKKTLAQIKAETGATHIINGGSFTSFAKAARLKGKDVQR